MSKKLKSGKRRITQRQVIRTHLLEGKSMTAMEAVNDYGIYRLSAIIRDFKKLDGILIESIKVPHVISVWWPGDALKVPDTALITARATRTVPV